MIRRFLGVAVALAIATVPLEPSASHADDAVARFLARADPPITRYRALRRLEARNERFNKSGWMEAWTELDPAHGLRFEIVDAGGSSTIRKKVLCSALEGERDAIAQNEPQRAALSLDNYAFALLERTPEGDALRITPKRKDRMLLDGRILLGLEDGDLLSIQGRLARNPSFWTTRVDVVRRYGRIHGMRVPTSMESVASVRIAGPSTFSMTYAYVTINGVTVGSPQPSAAVYQSGQVGPSEDARHCAH